MNLTLLLFDRIWKPMFPMSNRSTRLFSILLLRFRMPRLWLSVKSTLMNCFSYWTKKAIQQTPTRPTVPANVKWWNLSTPRLSALPLRLWVTRLCDSMLPKDKLPSTTRPFDKFPSTVPAMSRQQTTRQNPWTAVRDPSRFVMLMFNLR